MHLACDAPCRLACPDVAGGVQPEAPQRETDPHRHTAPDPVARACGVFQRSEAFPKCSSGGVQRRRIPPPAGGCLKRVFLRAKTQLAPSRSLAVPQIGEGAEDTITLADFALVARDGTIIESSLSTKPERITDIVDGFTSVQNRPTVMARDVRLKNGETAIVYARRLDGGQTLYAFRTTSAVLEGWTNRTIGLSLLIGASLIALIAVGIAFRVQALRATDADELCVSLSDRMQLALQRGRCGLWDWDLTSGKILWSPSMYDILGMSGQEQVIAPGDVIGLVHPEDQALFLGFQERIASTEPMAEHEFRLRHAEGRWVWLRARFDLIAEGKVAARHLIGVAIDITEQRALAEARHEADLRLREAVETMPDAFVLWDADGRLVVSNERYRQFHQIDEDKAAIGASRETVHGPNPVYAMRGPADTVSDQHGAIEKL